MWHDTPLDFSLSLVFSVADQSESGQMMTTDDNPCVYWTFCVNMVFWSHIHTNNITSNCFTAEHIHYSFQSSLKTDIRILTCLFSSLCDRLCMTVFWIRMRESQIQCDFLSVTVSKIHQKKLNLADFFLQCSSPCNVSFRAMCLHFVTIMLFFWVFATPSGCQPPCTFSLPHLSFCICQEILRGPYSDTNLPPLFKAEDPVILAPACVSLMLLHRQLNTNNPAPYSQALEIKCGNRKL